MLMQRWMHIAPQRIKDEVNALASRQLRGRDKIRISGNQDDLIDLALETQRRDVQPDAHIHAFLHCCVFKIIIG